MATTSGVAQALFPEGGLTRDGALRAPKLGILSYMVSGFDPQGPRDVVFVPVGLNYDRVLEDRIQSAVADTPAGVRPRFAFNPLVLARFLGRSLWLRLRGRWYRYGYACVGFGRPLSLRRHLAGRGVDLRAIGSDERHREIELLGERLMAEVGRVVPVLPVSLVATVMMASGGEQGLSGLELKGAVHNLMRRLQRAGAHVHIPRQDQEYAVDVGLRMLLLRRIVIAEDGVYRASPEERPLLAYYANAIAHLEATQASFNGPPSEGAASRAA
jgi:glycerol-3-phosphate O-acyltransferase